MMFDILKHIDPDDENSWKNKLFLTFDVDWACDDVLKHTIEIVENANIAATWFVTHDTDLLDRLRENNKFELGIHPNFNLLLNGDGKNGKTAEEVIERLMCIVPEARTVRSHSMTQSSIILDLFAKFGLTHDANTFIPEQASAILSPWYVWNNIVKVPYFWEDDVACLYKENTPIKYLKSRDGLKVFDFHPIHVFLNTEDIIRYERTRSIHHDVLKLIEHRNSGYGAHTALNDLLDI